MGIERFIAEYAQKGYQYAFHLCGNAEEAKELVQESFFRLIRRWERYDPGQSLENWFLTILRNLYFDGLKRYDRRNALSLEVELEKRDERALGLADLVADREGDLLERLERREFSEGVRRALEGLAYEHRSVLTLCDIQGLSYDKMAAVLDCPLGTVRSRVSRARRAFKAALRRVDAGVVLPRERA